MSVIISLMAAVTMGIPSEPPGNGPYEWTLDYHDGVVVLLGQTDDPQITFAPRASHRFKLQVCNVSGCTLSEDEHCVDPIPGDVRCDGIVGLDDYFELALHFGWITP